MLFGFFEYMNDYVKKGDKKVWCSLMKDTKNFDFFDMDEYYLLNMFIPLVRPKDLETDDFGITDYEHKENMLSYISSQFTRDATGVYYLDRRVFDEDIPFFRVQRFMVYDDMFILFINTLTAKIGIVILDKSLNLIESCSARVGSRHSVVSAKLTLLFNNLNLSGS